MSRAEKLKAKGFNFVKVELEAELHRGGGYCDYCDEGYIDCDICDGSGDSTCTECDGSGTITETINSEEVTNDCDSCDGSGYETCQECDGSGNETCPDCGGEYDDGELELEDIEQAFTEALPSEIRESLVYCRAYNDGSVDTEITMTYPVEHIDKTDKVIEAFNIACERFGKEQFTDNAGLHISISSESNPSNGKLDQDCLVNFKSQVAKLMAGMIMIASGGEWTRSFSFREPRIDSREKYSAIFTHGDRYLEYRIFDTCYHKPKMILDFVDMIIGTLKYYSKSKNMLDDYLTTGIKKNQRLSESFLDDESKARAIREMGYLISKGRVEEHVKKLGIK